VASRYYPIDASPIANLLVFLGTPFLLVSFVVPGIASVGVAGATAINAIFWFLVGSILGLTIRRPFIAALAWLLLAGILAAIALAGLILGMISSSP
jgi:hypothetical protein